FFLVSIKSTLFIDVQSIEVHSSSVDVQSFCVLFRSVTPILLVDSTNSTAKLIKYIEIHFEIDIFNFGYYYYSADYYYSVDYCDFVDYWYLDQHYYFGQQVDQQHQLE
ncbi:hypothetical protein DERP_006293, partial [Dermatophagoides pteronyssinus]